MLDLTGEDKKCLENGTMLPIMEHFYTIQGEGGNSGMASYFIRVGGCDVGCHWCDVKESWDASLHPLIEVDTLLPFLKDIPSKNVVITGGEPTLYNLDYLCEILHKNSFKTYIETSGSNKLTGRWNWICLSPKKTAPPIDSVYSLAHELKVIIHNMDDLKWAEEHAAKVNSECLLFLQPEWSKKDDVLPKIIDYVMANPKWQISIQTHKVMRIP